MRRLIFIFWILVTTGCTRDKLQPVVICDQPCYDARYARLAGKGVCAFGRWQCSEGEEPVCVGAVYPSAEVCDGLDNDCNGLVDDKVVQSCKGVCGDTGISHCVDGNWGVCEGTRRPTPEVCDGIDNDCNGLIDDNVPVELCYTGPPNALKGDCHPGFTVCQSGSKICTNQKLPSPEICDGNDNDCDGTIDNGLPGDDKLDLVFVVDASGSMTNRIAKISAATRSWVDKYSKRAGLRFALVLAPVPGDDSNTMPELAQNFTDATTFNAVLAQVALVPSVSSSEPTIDACLQLASTPNPMGLAYRDGVRRVVVLYSDEEPQSFTVPPTLFDDAVQALKDAKMTTHIFTLSNLFDKWKMLAQDTGGTMNDIEDPDIEHTLDTIIRLSTCGALPQ